ncbi:hypothetical protein JYU34_017993 [Plutella xylostella]|uniref:Vacuolar ATP synthase subunit S1 n=1 Tax=Plutella xylostella TaxID=51655 RepID=A0ABQ7PZG9_PLUXY|nr:hypothetical protein JYU34_017993 [Plutella xylostella]
MAFCRSVLVLSVLGLLNSVTASNVPVLMFGDVASTQEESLPLSKVSFTEFNTILKHTLVNDPFTVIFIEETLSVEDFSLKNSEGETSFPFLHSNIGKAVYLPSTTSPLRALNKLADPEKVDHVKLTENGLSAEIEPESGKFLFINLKDAKEGETRAELLRRHNDFIEELFGKLKKRYPEVVAVYTAHYPSWTIAEHHLRQRRQATEAQAEPGFYNLAGLMLYVKSMVLNDGGNTVTLSASTKQTMASNDTVLNATLEFGDRSVLLNFDNKAGYWFFNRVILTELSQGVSTVEELMPSEPVYALDRFSYRCAQAVVFTSVNTSRPYSLSFNDIKIQPYTSENQTDFGDSLNCQGFFSVAIWSGLFVVFILLAITFFGIMMMMDIRAMDRFDDPKGKTITVIAQE